MAILTRSFQFFDSLLGTNVAERHNQRKQKRKIEAIWRSTSRDFPVPASVETRIRRILSEIDNYWTPADKQVVLAHLIVSNNLKKAVEIGVYSGGSLIPQAVALKQTGGEAVGIDPYCAAAAEQKDNREILDSFDPETLNPDRDEMYRSVLQLLDRHGLSSTCRILRMTSNDAASKIEEGMDLLHIDGNHDYDRVMDDLTNYLPKLRVGGFLVVDDIDWGSIAPLYDLVKKQMKPVYEARTWGCCQKLQQRIEIQDPR